MLSSVGSPLPGPLPLPGPPLLLLPPGGPPPIGGPLPSEGGPHTSPEGERRQSLNSYKSCEISLGKAGYKKILVTVVLVVIAV